MPCATPHLTAASESALERNNAGRADGVQRGLGGLPPVGGVVAERGRPFELEHRRADAMRGTDQEIAVAQAAQRPRHLVRPGAMPVRGRTGRTR